MTVMHLKTNLHKRDPRDYQIVILGSLLVLGAIWGRIDTTAAAACIGVSAALLTQLCFLKFWLKRKKITPFDMKSPLISALSLLLLLRVPSLGWMAVAAILAITSKFLLRYKKKHLFNPANVAIVLCMLGGGAWLTPGQWGNWFLFAFLLAALGMFVSYRAARIDVTLSFLLAYGAILLGRAFYFGDPWAIPLHQLQSGALILFAFFMISDPKTTPNNRWARIFYGILVAVLAVVIRVYFYRGDAIIWALVLLSPTVALLDHRFVSTPFSWPKPVPAPGVLHA